ncbi:hypothetical protein BB559_000497 [Furculomyces boomerangus]|uniref:Uncharacterized protein n=2 Tax=Harpellales TaxID=61421 RepID=A0A2T9Z552_9FUNG|nr:hypothetical protein BB559_000497 [Furculomyces boomerangus]PVZ97479.1 hypothetical protein BB558_006549 [Smittium angustum]PVZ99631.1 hypothetical protein BB558_004335 [Smittium angustum]
MSKRFLSSLLQAPRALRSEGNIVIKNGLMVSNSKFASVWKADYSKRVNKIVFEDEVESLPEGVNPGLYNEYFKFMNSTKLKDLGAILPRKSLLHTFLQKIQNKEEFELGLKLLERWRKHYVLPLSERTTWILLSKCQYLNDPEPLTRVLLDRWRYKAFPTDYIYTSIFKLISNSIHDLIAIEGQESELANKYLDDLFRLFASIPQYNLEQGAWAYSSLITSLVDSGMEEGWVRAVQVAEEAMVDSIPPKINYEAALKLQEEYAKRGDSTNSNVYKEMISNYNLKPKEPTHVAFDEEGRMYYKPIAKKTN